MTKSKARRAAELAIEVLDLLAEIVPWARVRERARRRRAERRQRRERRRKRRREDDRRNRLN
jgi:hypothetical protein